MAAMASTMGDGTRQHAGVMTSFGFHGRVCAVDIYSMLLHQNCGNWFECHTEVNVLSVADASLYSSGINYFLFLLFHYYYKIHHSARCLLVP